MPQLETLIDEVLNRYDALQAAGTSPLKPEWEGNLSDIPHFQKAQSDVGVEFLRHFKPNREALISRTLAEFPESDAQFDATDIAGEIELLANEALKQRMQQCGLTEADAEQVALRIRISI